MSVAVATNTQMGRLFRLAIISGADGAVQAHLARGEDVNAVDSRGLSPLMIAAGKGHLSTCRVLLKAGSDVTALDGNGNDALWHAASSGVAVIVDLLTPQPSPVVVEIENTRETPSTKNEEREADSQSLFWESDDEPECPPLLIVPLENARRLQREMASCRAQMPDPDIQFDVQLPILTPKRGSTLEIALPELAHLLAAAKSGGWISLERIGRLARDASIKALHFRQAFEAAGILVGELWPFELPDEPSANEQPTQDAEEIVEYIDSLTAIAVDPLDLYLKDLLKFPRLDRFEEDSLARSGNRGMQLACLALASCPEGLAILNMDLDDVSMGSRSLSSISSLFETSGRGAVADDDSEAEGADTEDSVPGEFIAAVEDLRRAISNSNHDAQSTDSRTLSRQVRNLGLTTEYLAELCNALSSREAFVVGLCEIQRGLNGAEKARRRLVQAHFGQVVYAAARFGRSLPLADLVQEGNIGLLRAAEKLDPERGNRFWTYAIWWVRQAMARASADKSRIIRLPVHVSQALSRLREMDRESIVETGKVKDASWQAEEVGISIQLVNRLREWRGEPISTGMLVSDRTDPCNLLSIPSDECVFEAVVAKDLCCDIEIALQGLEARQADIIRRRFGLAGLDQQTLEEVGSIYGVTRERIRQIEVKALRKLRHPDSSYLRCYL
jgi:RNA polymerase primary sigma factor